MSGGPPPRGEVVGVFTVKHTKPSGDRFAVTLVGENGTAIFTLDSDQYKKVVISITESPDE